jgi:hypothetical protein
MSYTADRIRHALPIVPFAFDNEPVQHFQHSLLTEFHEEFLWLPLNFTSYRHAKFRRMLTFLVRFLIQT